MEEIDSLVERCSAFTRKVGGTKTEALLAMALVDIAAEIRGLREEVAALKRVVTTLATKERRSHAKTH